MNQNPPRRSLRRKLVFASAVAMLAMAVAMMAIFFFGFDRIWDNSFRAIGQLHSKLFGMNLASARSYWRDALEQSCLEISHDIDSAAATVEVGVKSLAALERLGADRALTRRIVDEYGRNNPAVGFLVFAWEDGDFFVANGKHTGEGYDPRRRDWYRNAFKTHPRPFWTPIYPDYSTNTEVLSLAQAFTASDGKLAGALCLDLHLAKLFDLAAEHSDNGRTVFVLDDNLVFILPERFPTGAALHGRAFPELFTEDAALGAALASAKARKVGQWELADSSQRYLVSLAPCEVSNWTVGVLMPMEEVEKAVAGMAEETDSAFRTLEDNVTSWGRLLKGGTVIAMLTVLGASLWLLRRSVAKGLRPLEELTRGVLSLGRGDLSVRLKAGNEDEIQTLAETYNEMVGNLARHIELLREETARAARVDGELQLARDIQIGLLPGKFPEPGGRYDLYAVMRPAREVGGDLYDFFQQGEKLYFAVADVSDKGVAAGLFMSVVKTLFRGMTRDDPTPEEMLLRINEILAEQNPQNMFVTMFIGVLDLPTHILKYASAGHCPPLSAEPGRGFYVMPCPRALPLGVMVPVAYSGMECAFPPGSRLFVYTDGVTEAMNRDEELFGEDRLAAALARTSGLTPREALATVEGDVHRHVRDAGLTDDLTMLLLECNPP